MEKEDKKPIKRSEEMAPLSREHHEGLMLVWKIRQGVKKEIEVARIADYIEWFWQQHLLPHFKKEEEYLVNILPAENELMQQMFTEHRQLKILLDNLNAESNYNQLESLAKMVNDHIRFEERILFNEIEKAATSEQLQHLPVVLNEGPVCAKWSDEFWLNAKR